MGQCETLREVQFGSCLFINKDDVHVNCQRGSDVGRMQRFGEDYFVRCKRVALLGARGGESTARA